MVEALGRYNKILGWSVVLVSLIAVLGIVLVNSTSPHIRSVGLPSGSSQQEVTVLKPAIDIFFSHPMDRKSVESSFSVQPDAKVALNWSLNNLQINFAENLDLDTEYTIQVTKQAKDVFGKTLNNDFAYTFHTQSPKFTYLERNGVKQLPDRIISYDLKSNSSTELYSSVGIDYFARNKRYLVVSEIDVAKVSTVHLIDLETKNVTNIAIGNIPFRLTRLAFSPRYDQFAFVAQEVVNRNGVAIPQGSSYMYLYDIPSSTLKKYAPPNALDVLFSPDGGSLLFRGDEAIYYLMDLQTEDLIDMERHFASGGFSRDVNRIVFVDYDPISTGSLYPNINIYNTDRDITSITNGEEFVVDPEFFHRAELIVYSEKYQDLDGTKGLFSVIISDLQQNRLAEIKREGISLELPKLSADDRYILIENYLPQELQDYNNMRNYVFQTKPYSGGLSIYDRKSESFMQVDLRGVDAVWN